MTKRGQLGANPVTDPVGVMRLTDVREDFNGRERRKRNTDPIRWIRNEVDNQEFSFDFKEEDVWCIYGGDLSLFIGNTEKIDFLRVRSPEYVYESSKRSLEIQPERVRTETDVSFGHLDTDARRVIWETEKGREDATEVIKEELEGRRSKKNEERLVYHAQRAIKAEEAEGLLAKPEFLGKRPPTFDLSEPVAIGRYEEEYQPNPEDPKITSTHRGICAINGYEIHGKDARSSPQVYGMDDVDMEVDGLVYQRGDGRLIAVNNEDTERDMKISVPPHRSERGEYVPPDWPENFRVLGSI
ncbi:MAG: hypothetical protein ABEJ03_00060 [Candidatus Nanohaloarchaea archaeon]